MLDCVPSFESANSHNPSNIHFPYCTAGFSFGACFGQVLRLLFTVPGTAVNVVLDAAITLLAKSGVDGSAGSVAFFGPGGGLWRRAQARNHCATVSVGWS